MKTFHEIRIPYEKDPDLTHWVSQNLGLESPQIEKIQILKRSLDARNKNQLYWVFSIRVYLKGEKDTHHLENFRLVEWKGPPPLIIGAGPAGLFAALTFLEHGIRPILFEQGDRTYPRMRKISQYWRHGILDPQSNVCHGEGGAGTFSDGKLITRIKSPWIHKVMQTFVDCGAPPEITYVYNPHVGSNLIREVIRNLSDQLIARGASLQFNTAVKSLDLSHKELKGVCLSDGKKVEGTGLILASGHSASGFFKTLHEQGLNFEAKPFAVGLRIEHPQQLINEWQYGKNYFPELETAQYKLKTYWETENIGVYSFCMCPGGYVISSGTEAGRTVINGMSNYHRNSPWANAALVCTVDTSQIEGNHPFKMLHFQQKLEENTYQKAASRKENWKIPAQSLEDFLANRPSQNFSSSKKVSSCPSGVIPTNLSDIFPTWITQHLRQAILDFEEKRPGFIYPHALLHAVESRTSSPVKIPRDPETLEALSLSGLFPCGEGPGYAGGITSAAVDGIKAALGWIKKFCD